MDKTVRADRGKHARGRVVRVDKKPPKETQTRVADDNAMLPTIEAQAQSPADQRVEWIKVLEQFPDWAEKYLWIDTKGGDGQRAITKFKLNKVQRHIHSRVVDRAKRGEPLWFVIPKARQEGVSTYAEGLIFRLTQYFDHKTGAVVAHDEKAVKNILRKSRVFYDRLPDDQKLATNYHNRAELEYKEPHGSRLMVAVCGSGEGLGQSYTIHFGHFSEISLWGRNTPDPEHAWDALMGAIPKHARTLVIAESSPQGRDGLLYPLVQSASSGDSEFEVIFLPWYADDGYEQPFNGEFVRTADEVALADAVFHDSGSWGGVVLTDAQLNWRRKKISSDYRGNVHTFRQYFPSFLSECFAATERAYFDAGTIEYYREITQRALPTMGRLDETKDGVVGFAPDIDGNVAMWKPPASAAEYIIGADIADGIPGRDWSHAIVVNKNTGEEVASAHCRISPDEFSDLVNRLGSFYNWAEVAGERNRNPQFIYRLWHHHNYPNLYWMSDPEKPGAKASMPGWHTNKRTRQLMLSTLQMATREKLYAASDTQFPEEMATFVWNNAEGMYGAAPGKKDDRVMAAAIVCQLLDLGAIEAVRAMDGKNTVSEVKKPKTAVDKYKEFVARKQRNTKPTSFVFGRSS